TLAAGYLARLSSSPDLPRDIEPLLGGGLTLHLLATHLADRLTRLVCDHTGEDHAWPQIAFVLNHDLPLVIGDEQAEVLAIPADSVILKAVLELLAIEAPALIKSARGRARTRRKDELTAVLANDPASDEE